MVEFATFVRVVEAGSMSAAARAMGVPRSTVSRHLSRLEDELGVRLMQRTTRVLSLTEAGEEYYHRVRRIVAELDEAAEAVQCMDGEPRGRLRVSIPKAGGNIGVRQLFVDYCRRYPEVELELLQTNRRVDLVAEGIDVALRGGPAVDSSLIARRIGPARRMCVASPAYLDARGTPSTPDDLSDHDCNRGLIDDLPERAWPLLAGGSVPVSGRITADDPGLLGAAAVAGLGIACIPVVVVLQHLERGELVPVLPDTVGNKGSISIVYPARDHLPAKVRAFIDLCVQTIPASFQAVPEAWI